MTVTQEYYTSFVMEQLRALRLHAGVSRSQVAYACQCSEATVCTWEQSPRPDITLKQITAYAGACGYVPLVIAHRERIAWEQVAVMQ